MKPTLIVISLACMLACGPAMAETTPGRGSADPRVRMVDYNPADVVRLTTFYGVSTHVRFGADETIQDIAIGDEQAWSIVPRGGHLFIKPKQTNADTNVTVVTNKRAYQFALVVQPRDAHDEGAWRDPNLIFSLSFRYPEEEEAKRVVLREAEDKKARALAMQQQLASAKTVVRNLEYWAAGSSEITPTSAYDDGRFIYLTFSRNRDMPAVYGVNEQGAEAVIIPSVEGNTLIVQRLERRLTLRKGDAVVCIVNRAFNPDSGLDNSSGTITPNVERVIKENRP